MPGFYFLVPAFVMLFNTLASHTCTYEYKATVWFPRGVSPAESTKNKKPAEDSAVHYSI